MINVAPRPLFLLWELALASAAIVLGLTGRFSNVLDVETSVREVFVGVAILLFGFMTVSILFLTSMARILARTCLLYCGKMPARCGEYVG